MQILDPQIWSYLQNVGLKEHACDGIVASVFVWAGDGSSAVFCWW